MDKIKVTRDYGGRKVDEYMVPGNQHCPFCGSKKVWSTCDGGDYYMGESCICLSCNKSFHSVSTANLDQHDISAQIKARLNQS